MFSESQQNYPTVTIFIQDYHREKTSIRLASTDEFEERPILVHSNPIFKAHVLLKELKC